MSATTTADRAESVGQALRAAARRLDAAQIDAPRLVAETLLAHALDLSRGQILARFELALAPGQLTNYQTLIDRCAAGEPLAYVLGHREFYGLDFRVDRRVLIPRPETEVLIDVALAIVPRPDCHMADIGTGSGAIAVTLAARLPQARITATDISPGAIEVASENARRHGVADRVAFKIGDLLTPLEAPVDVIVANLPYVRSREWTHLADTIRAHEPAIAFDGGSDGLALISRLLSAAPRALRPGGAVLMEIGASHGEAAHELARDSFPDADIAIRADYAGRDRLLVVRTAARRTSRVA